MAIILITRAWASNLDESSSGHVSGTCLRAANRLLRRHAARQYERQGYSRDKCQPLHQHFPSKGKVSGQFLTDDESLARSLR